MKWGERSGEGMPWNGTEVKFSLMVNGQKGKWRPPKKNNKMEAIIKGRIIMGGK